MRVATWAAHEAASLTPLAERPFDQHADRQSLEPAAIKESARHGCDGRGKIRPASHSSPFAACSIKDRPRALLVAAGKEDGESTRLLHVFSAAGLDSNGA